MKEINIILSHLDNTDTKTNQAHSNPERGCNPVEGDGRDERFHDCAARPEERQVGILVRTCLDEAGSLEAQEERVRAHAAARGLKVMETYRLRGVSSPDVARHPEMQRMLADVQRGHVPCLLVSQFHRLSRDSKSLLDFVNVFQANGASLISVDEGVDLSAPSGQFVLPLILAFAEWERKERCQRIRAGIAYRKARIQQIANPQRSQSKPITPQ